MGMPALIESQRRLRVAVEKFEDTSRASAKQLVAAEELLLRAIQTSSDCASQQTAHAIRLTLAMKTLTWVLVFVGLLQVLVTWWSRS